MWTIVTYQPDNQALPVNLAEVVTELDVKLVIYRLTANQSVTRLTLPGQVEETVEQAWPLKMTTEPNRTTYTLSLCQLAWLTQSSQTDYYAWLDWSLLDQLAQLKEVLASQRPGLVISCAGYPDPGQETEAYYSEDRPSLVTDFFTVDHQTLVTVNQLVQAEAAPRYGQSLGQTLHRVAHQQPHLFYYYPARPNQLIGDYLAPPDLGLAVTRVCPNYLHHARWLLRHICYQGHHQRAYQLAKHLILSSKPAYFASLDTRDWAGILEDYYISAWYLGHRLECLDIIELLSWTAPQPSLLRNTDYSLADIKSLKGYKGVKAYYSQAVAEEELGSVLTLAEEAIRDGYLTIIYFQGCITRKAWIWPNNPIIRPTTVKVELPADVTYRPEETNLSPNLAIYPQLSYHYKPGRIDPNLTIFTDEDLNSAINSQVKHKVLWLQESPEMDRIKDIVNWLQDESHQRIFDLILTCQRSLLKLGPRFQFMTSIGTWVAPEDRRLYPKSKLISIVASSKRTMPGHQLRHQIIAQHPEIPAYGRAYQPIRDKIEALADFHFTVLIENVCEDYYFSEKLLDAFLTGTVPVFWGCPSIGRFFNLAGMLTFQTAEEFDQLLPTLTAELYQQMLPAIEDNFQRAQDYAYPEKLLSRYLGWVE